MRRIAGLIVAALLASAAGCAYNHIVFEEDSVKLADKLTIEPGQGGDSSDTGATGGSTPGGSGKMSPGGSNLVDGQLNLTMLFQLGSETPTTPTTTASANVQSPGGTAATGGQSGTATGTPPATGTGGSTP